jgi:ABC-type cobalamin transport system permease subunit
VTAAEVPPSRTGGRPSPFAIFGLAAALAAVGAVWEMSYFAGNSALSPGTLGTTIGIVIALVAFFVLGMRAAPNE